jgi:hypothetical protein
VARWQQEELAAVARVGPGQADVGQRALPEVVQQADDGSGRDLDHDRTLGDVDVDEGVDRRVVGREPDRLGADEVVGDAQVVEGIGMSRRRLIGRN